MTTEDKPPPRKRAPRKAAKAVASQPEPDEAQTVGEAVTGASMGKVSDEDQANVPTMAQLAEEAYREAMKGGRLVEIGPPPIITYPTVIQAFSAVMREVISVGKDDYNEQQRFRFRGVDAVVNAVGPACRKHGVVVVPRKVKEHSAVQYTTVSGTRMTNRVVHIRYRVYGPAGDYFDGEAFGESADAGDKSMSKAQSVAERVFLLQSGLIPTGDPDPDSESHERGDDSTPVNAGLAQRKREEWEAAQAAKQDQTRQAQAGEENQDAPRQQQRPAQTAPSDPPTSTETPKQPDPGLDKARQHMWRTAKGLGWTWDKLAARFKADHGVPTDQSDVATVQAFTAIILKEAEAEEDRAKALVANELGGKPVEEPPFPDSTPGSERLL